MKATLVFRRKDVLPSGTTIDATIWRLPKPTKERPQGLKCRLQAHRGGRTLVRYDNETGKGDHRHYGQREMPYVFRSVERLIEDFLGDVDRLEGENGT